MTSYYTWCECHREIGLTDGAVPLIAGYEIRRPVTLWCGCGVPSHWRPVKSRQDAAPVLVYRHVCYTDSVEV